MQDIENFSAKLLEKAKKFGATDAEILVGVSDDLSVSVRKNKLEEIDTNIAPEIVLSETFIE